MEFSKPGCGVSHPENIPGFPVEMSLLRSNVKIRSNGLRKARPQEFFIIGLPGKNIKNRNTPRPGLEPGSKDPQSFRMSTTLPGQRLTCLTKIVLLA